MSHSPKTLLLAAVAAIALVGASAGDARAYLMTVETNSTGGNAFNATPTSGFNTTNEARATFSYNGKLNFSNTNAQSVADLNSYFFTSPGLISGYSGTGASRYVDFSTIGTFLAAVGSSAGYVSGSLYTINLGLQAAGTILKIAHDDGVSVYQNGARIGNTTAGATVQVTETVALTSTAETFLYYSRQNGSPSVLIVEVPEPVSMGLLGAGLVGIGMVRRRRAV